MWACQQSPAHGCPYSASLSGATGSLYEAQSAGHQALGSLTYVMGPVISAWMYARSQSDCRSSHSGCRLFMAIATLDAAMVEGMEPTSLNIAHCPSAVFILSPPSTMRPLCTWSLMCWRLIVFDRRQAEQSGEMSLRVMYSSNAGFAHLGLVPYDVLPE